MGGEVTNKTGSVFCRSALWDCFGVAISYFIGYYQVALETGIKFVPQNSPTMQFDTTPPQSYAEPSRAQLVVACVAGAWK